MLRLLMPRVLSSLVMRCLSHDFMRNFLRQNFVQNGFHLKNRAVTSARLFLLAQVVSYSFSIIFLSLPYENALYIQ